MRESGLARFDGGCESFGAVNRYCECHLSFFHNAARWVFHNASVINHDVRAECLWSLMLEMQ